MEKTRILFLCGSMEHGKDGVGDYVRRLGCFLKQQGHEVTAIAYHDKYTGRVSDEMQESDGGALRVLRLPSPMLRKERLRMARSFVKEVAAETVSLQFVPYAFQKKGIPLMLRSDLKRLVGERGLHIMFHELWLDTPIGIKQRMTALVQQRVVRSLVKRLRPQSVNVSIPFNKSRLKKLQIDSEILELFGNIYAAEGQDSAEIGPDATFSVLYFGSPPKGAFKALLLSKLADFCKSKAAIKIAMICGHSAAKNEFYAQLNEELRGIDSEIIDYGFLPIAALSKLMLSCDVGIVRSEPHLLGKSGSAIAMLEHGLPIWLPKCANPEEIDYPFRPELIFADLHQVVNNPPRPKYHSLLPAVAKEFICQIKRAKK